MFKRAVWIVIIILITATVGVFLFNQRWFINKRPTPLLGNDAIIYVYLLGGQQTGGGVVSIPYLSTDRGQWNISAWLDANQDGNYADDELVVNGQGARVYSEYRNNFVLDLTTLSITAGQNLPLRVALIPLGTPVTASQPTVDAGELKTMNAAVEYYEFGDLIGLDVTGASVELKRGIAGLFNILKPNLAQAQSEGGGLNAFREPPLPDIRQESMECTPTSAANNLISLAQEHDAGNQLPQNPQDIIDELKQDMNFNNGVLINNIVTGKNAFAQRHNLPIVSELILRPTAQQIAQAIESGCVVELSMGWVRSRSGYPDTGHVVSVVGVTNANGINQVQVHDPATPTGMDTYNLDFEVRAGDKSLEGITYPGWDGIAFIDAMVVECWQEPERARTSVDDSDKSSVEMLVIDGHYFPKYQFRVGDPDVCDAHHYHAGTVYGLRDKTSTDVVSMTDPNPGSCGFGRVREVSVEFIDITFEQSQALVAAIP